MEKEITAKEAQREYYREWRAKNKERIKKSNARYWKRRAEKMSEKKREGVAES